MMEIPMTKSQIPTKSQRPNPNRMLRTVRDWGLGFGILLGFGGWDLGFFPDLALPAFPNNYMPDKPRLDGPWLWKEKMACDAKDAGAWKARAAEIRKRILVSAGLWPLPERTPLNAEVYGRVECDEYSVEKVRFQSYPGFYVSGNLYRPHAHRYVRPPYPAVINPHGHWTHGRLEVTDNANFPGLGANLARLGFVCFAYDMVGYADCKQVQHNFAPNLDWGVDPSALQLWNSIRVLDFMESLPDVDPKRIACTGASGGGTQTFLLAAVDDRVAVSVPVNMVSHEYPGGCLCENLPLLRVGVSNVEIAAAIAPRPQLLVCCTGDWTQHVPEGAAPDIKKVYELFGAGERLAWVRYDFPHNYNQNTREAMYAWVSRWLNWGSAVERIPEQLPNVEPHEFLTVYDHTHPLPKDALDEAGLVAKMKGVYAERLESLRPRDAASLARFREVIGAALPHVWTVDWPQHANVAEEFTELRGFGPMSCTIVAGLGHGLANGVLCHPEPAVQKGRAVVIAQPTGKEPEGPNPLVQFLNKAGCTVFVIFLDGDAETLPDPSAEEKRFPGSYHRTGTAWDVQHLVDALAYVRTLKGVTDVKLVGLGRTGPAALIAGAISPDVSRVIVDLSEMPKKTQPCSAAYGGFPAAAALVAPRGLVLHGVPPDFDATWAKQAYTTSRAGAALRIEGGRLTDEEIVQALKK